MTPTRTTSPATRAHGAKAGQELRLPALRVRQGPNRVLYSFAVDGKQLPQFTTVSRIHRGSSTGVQGYQRPEVLSHIAAIRKYLDSEDPMIPNAIVIAFDKRVVFETSGANDGISQAGTLVIPIDAQWSDEDKPGWIVDGQQRCAAIRESRLEAFPICVTAFITDSDAEQRSQFILVNSTKPLPKGLIHELLPSTVGALPATLQLRRFPATLLDRLNYDEDSPLQLLIQTPTNPQGVVKDNSILRMLENSLSDGALYQYRHAGAERGDAEAPEDAEQTLDQLRKVIIELSVNTRVQERHGFDQAQNVRIVDRFRPDPQPTGDFRVCLCKCRALPAHIAQFVLVVFQQVLKHPWPREPGRWCSPAR